MRRYLIYDKSLIVPVVQRDDGLFVFPMRGGQTAQQLLHTIVHGDPKEVLQGMDAVIAKACGYTGRVEILGPDSYALWTALGYGEEVQISLRMSYRTCVALLYARHLAQHTALQLRAQMDHLLSLMEPESVCLMEEYERRAARQDIDLQERGGGQPKQFTVVYRTETKDS